jgi:hypothetical protein
MVVCAIVAAACGTGPTSVTLPPLEVLIASGDSQYGTAGQTLPVPLQVHVRAITTELPHRGANVAWTVVSGGAAIEGVTSTVTDSTGGTQVRVRLGSTLGSVTVRAAVQGQQRASALFRLFTVDQPTLEGVEPTSADPGTSVTLSGTNFSPHAEQNVVLFSGVRGPVTGATSTQLEVTVPTCLPARQVEVTVQLGTVASGSASLTVGPGGDLLSMPVRGTFDSTDDDGLTCVTVPGEGGASYLVAVHAASSVGAATHPYRLTGLAATGPLLAADPARTSPRGYVGTRIDARRTAADAWQRFVDGRLLEPGEAPNDVQGLWDGYLREREAQLTRDRAGFLSEPRVIQSPKEMATSVVSGVPAVNERRTFQVFRSAGNFVEVTAVARYVGSLAAFFVDEDTPAGGYDQADLQYFSDLFDQLIHPSVTNAFGTASDLDENDRIVILFSPAVNALTPRGSTGFVGGFFFGVDLLPEATGSNAGEIFYALVPDPEGQFSDPRPKAGLLEITPAIMGHEFQHMVHFNQRVLVRGAAANEAVWLSEGLAQFAEELIARTAAGAGSPEDEVEIFRDGTRIRSRRYLARPDTVSLVISAGSGNLPERGAGFLYLLYLADRFGDGVARDLTATTRTGVSNVEFTTGTEWAPLLSDWWSAVYLDGPDPELGALVYPSVDLKGFLTDPFPLAVTDLGGGDFTRSGSLRSSAVAYYIVNPASGGSTTLRLGGQGGGVSAPQALMRMRIIRVQ